MTNSQPPFDNYQLRLPLPVRTPILMLSAKYLPSNEKHASCQIVQNKLFHKHFKRNKNSPCDEQQPGVIIGITSHMPKINSYTLSMPMKSC